MEALKLSPNHLYGHASYITSLVQTNPDSAVHYCLNLRRKDPLDPGSSWDILDMTEALIKLQRLKEAEEWLDTLRREGFDNIRFRLMQGRMRLLQGRLDEAETEFQKALDMDIMHGEFQILTFALLGELKDRRHKPQEAEGFFKKAIYFPYRWDQNYLKNEAHFLYGRFLAHQNRPAEAELQFEYALKISPKTWHYPLGMALLAAKNGRNNAALDSLEKALDRYYFDEVAIGEEPLFAKLHKTKRFKALLAKHFPKTTKQ